jgi:hypothetical protein
MTQRDLCIALVTLNVYQNLLARNDPRCGYYANRWQELAQKPVHWYMTGIDWLIAWQFAEFFELEVDEACWKIYRRMLHRSHPCPISDEILEFSGTFQLNFCDQLRLACAIECGADVIVTQEPHQFARTAEEYWAVHQNGYFYLEVPMEPAEPDDPAVLKLGVFSVSSFLLNFDQIVEQDYLIPAPNHPVFSIQQLRVICDDENEAQMVLCAPNQHLFSVTMRGNSPFEAIQTAVDSIVDHCCAMPPRRLVRYHILATPLTGADSPVEVVVGVECQGLLFEKSARSANSMRAAADAYVKVINAICERLRLPIRCSQSP